MATKAMKIAMQTLSRVIARSMWSQSDEYRQTAAERETSRYLMPAAIATPVELTVILGQDAPTEDQSGNSRRIESATSHGPCASRCRAHMRVLARKSAAVDPAATRSLRTRRDAAL